MSHEPPERSVEASEGNDPLAKLPLKQEMGYGRVLRGWEGLASVGVFE